MTSLAQLESLEARVAILSDLVNRIQPKLIALFSAVPAQGEELPTLIADAIAHSNQIRSDTRDALAAVGIAPNWFDKAALLDSLEAARKALVAKQASDALSRLRDLADILIRGRVNHHFSRIREKLNALREKAAEELSKADGAAVRPLPGPPEVEGWLEWYWSGGEAAEQAVDDIRERFASLATFLESVSREQWQPVNAASDPLVVDGSGPVDVPLSPGQAETPPPITTGAEATGAGDTAAVAVPTEPNCSTDYAGPSEAEDVSGAAPTLAVAIVNYAPPISSESVTDDVIGERNECVPETDPVDRPAVTEQISAPTEAISPKPRPILFQVDAVPAPALHADEVSFEAFCKKHWITPHGSCEPAPWRLPGFTDDLSEALFQSLQSEQFGRARLFASAAVELQCDTIPIPEEVDTWARLWQRPREAIGLGPESVSMLRTAAEVGKLDGSKIWQFRLCMEALRPSPELPLGDNEARKWVEAVSFSSGALREILVLLLRVGRSTDHPIDEIRRVRKASGLGFADLAQILEDKRREFHVEIRRVWSAAGGKVTRTHCRRAWDDFIGQIKLLVEALYPTSLGGKADWNPDELARQINRLPKTHKDIADRWDAKFRDRHTMDRTAESITIKAAEINDLYRKKKAAESDQKARTVSDDELTGRTESFLTESPSSDAFEECCRRLVLRHIEHKTGSEPKSGLTAEDILAHPALLGCVAGEIELQSSNGADEVIIPFSSVVSPAAAAAVLLQPGTTTSPSNNGEKLVDRLAGLLLPLKRYDLLAPLTRHLALSDQAKVRTVRNDMVADMMRVCGEIRRIWERLGDLAYPAPSSLKDCLDEGVRRLRGEISNEAAIPDEQLLLKAWFERLGSYGDRLRSYAVDAFRRSVSTDDHPLQNIILQALDEGRYADAMFVRSEASGVSTKPEVARRRTAWRKQAKSRFPDPAQALKTFNRSLERPGRVSADLSELIEKWLTGVSGSPTEDQRLRTKFADVVFANTLWGKEIEQLRAQGKSEKTHFWMPCQKIREYLSRQGLNPSFLPQLARAEELVLITPPAKVSEPSLVQQTANLIAGSHANRLVAVLAPHISRDQRAALLQELRQRKLAAAVVDSLDLCRLLNIDGRQINLVIGLLELMLEQQRWIDSSPFHAHDGAQARIEMYVGRVQEANVLATDNKYSRLFSGRKLGKSALLKFIEETYDKFRLPSGNTLRVLRIPIVGIQSDAMVINKVLSELRIRLSFQSTAGPEHSVDAFLSALAEYLKVHPNESLLVILDEADVFVEKQLEDYDLQQERCLSFRIRSDAQKEVDQQGLPRIRFVFAGYRKANTRGGAWGNWGDPLLLNPLEAEEAADLIAGPLARLGIDASAVAPSIAFRCGYQPAVLLRFGEKLLEVFDNRFPDVAGRDHVVVMPEQVAEVYQHQAIQDEIRTVVRNNFQGNDAGQAVFSATVLAFAALVPGDALPNAPEVIWERLRELVDSHPHVMQVGEAIGWLARSDGIGPTEVGLNEVKRHLEDFVERKLLVIVNRDDGIYRLRFPYHLSSLLVGVKDEAWAALLRLSRGATSARDDDRTGDPLTVPTLRDLETVLKKYVDLGLHYRAAVLGSLWLHSVTSPDWLANRLGFDPGRLNFPGHPRNTETDAFLDVKAIEAQGIMDLRQPDAPPAFLVGGVDLLRWGFYAAQAGAEIEVQAQGRLTRLAVERWFRRTRGFDFQGDELEQIIIVTGRMPYLLNLFDQCLREAVGADAGGIHVSSEDFAKAKVRYDKRLPECLSCLLSGSETVRLTPREVDLLLMVTVVARANDFRHPVTLHDLGLDWEQRLYEDQWNKDFTPRTYPKAWFDTPEDRLAVRVVTDLGLIPHPIDRPDANFTISLDDPLVQVIVPALVQAGV